MGGIDVGYAISRLSEVRVGYGLGYGNGITGSGAGLSLLQWAERKHARAIRHGPCHDPILPTAGYIVLTNFQFFITASQMLHRASSSGSVPAYFQPPFGVTTPYSIVATGGSTLGYQKTETSQFFLGGVGRLSAYGLNELMGNQYLCRPHRLQAKDLHVTHVRWKQCVFYGLW